MIRHISLVHEGKKINVIYVTKNFTLFIFFITGNGEKFKISNLTLSRDQVHQNQLMIGTEQAPESRPFSKTTFILAIWPRSGTIQPSFEISEETTFVTLSLREY